MRKENWLINLVCVKNGFTLAEVRDYRKNLREVMHDSLKEGYRFTVAESFIWKDTDQGEYYWERLHKKLYTRGLYNGK